jgi:predicted N-acetyltransferase YhbS
VQLSTIIDSADLTPALRAEIATCWADVSDAGGAVGFPYAPVDRAEVTGAVDAIAELVRAATAVLFVARDDGGVAGWVALERDRFVLHQHWAWIRRLQSHPRCRGQRVGAQLMANLIDYARDAWAAEFVQLSLRGGRGLEVYYAQLGFTEVGRVPGALRLSPTEAYDEVFMTRALEKPGTQGLTSGVDAGAVERGC